jgi:hypothetical protein
VQRLALLSEQRLVLPLVLLLALRLVLLWEKT